MSEDLSNNPVAIASNLTESEWNQVRETIVMLNLATAQVQYSMTDGDDSIEVLADSFTTMSDGIRTIGEALESFSHFSNVDPVLHNEVMSQCHDVSSKMQKAIVAFQFYDKLVQRLSHVRNSLNKLAALIADEKSLHSVMAWKTLQNDVRAAYTMEEDRVLFDAIMAGTPIDQVMQQMLQLKLNDKADDIEFF